MVLITRVRHSRTEIIPSSFEIIMSKQPEKRSKKQHQIITLSKKSRAIDLTNQTRNFTSGLRSRLENSNVSFYPPKSHT